MRSKSRVKLVILLLVAAGATAGAAGPQEKQVDPAAWGDDHVRKPPPQLVGGDECLFCHRATVGPVWQKDPHFLTVRDKFQQLRTAPEIELLGGERPYKRFAPEVSHLLGLKEMVRFLRRGEGGGFELLTVGLASGRAEKPARWVVKGKPGWDGRKFSEGCIGCHMTGINPETLRPFETFVGCESCHGPFDERHTSGTLFMRFARKAKEPPQMIASTCGQCHLRGGRSRSTGRPFPNNFVSGDNLFRDFAFDFSRADDPDLNPIDAHIQRNIRDIVIYAKTDLTCISCHKMHPASHEAHRRRARTDYCLTCHKKEPFKDRKPYEVHSDTCEY